MPYAKPREMLVVFHKKRIAHKEKPSESWLPTSQRRHNMTISRADLTQSATEPSDAFVLSGALADLQDVADYAHDEGFPIPSKSAFNSAGRLLREIHKISALHLEVYPTPDGEIAIHVPNGRGRSVLLLCDSAGGALCLANLESGHRRKSYTTADALPDKFMRQAFMDLESEQG